MCNCVIMQGKEVIALWHRQQVLITKEQHEWLRQKAHEQKISIAELIRRIIGWEMRTPPKQPGE